MKVRHLLILLFFTFVLNGAEIEKKKFHFSKAPIDVIIPCHKKDLDTLDLCIEGIKKNGEGVRRVIVVSAERLTSNAEWFDEKKYPFSKKEVFDELSKRIGSDISERWFGWYYQQLLKFYAIYAIPNISPNVLCLDSDTIFLNPVSFLTKEGAGLYNPGTEYHWPYFQHIIRFVPGLKKLYKNHSGISHHMLFQKPILDDLFLRVEKKHAIPFWAAFLRSIPYKDKKTPSASEYEIYFNYAFTICDKVKIRPLSWKNVSSLREMEESRANGVHYISAHSYMREPS